VLALACAAPVAVALVSALLAIGPPALARAFWPEPATNVAAAAALGDAARVRVLAARGAPLDVPMPVPRGYVDDAPPAMSALEAAVRRRSEELAAVLIDLGVRPSPEEAHRLFCLSTMMETEEVAAMLKEAFAVEPAACDAPPEHDPGN
jgi:hypothetical protein